MKNIMTRSHRSALAILSSDVVSLPFTLLKLVAMRNYATAGPFVQTVLKMSGMLFFPVYSDIQVRLLEAVFSIDPSLSTRKLTSLFNIFFHFTVNVCSLHPFRDFGPHKVFSPKISIKFSGHGNRACFHW